jgi:hypothetical protein
MIENKNISNKSDFQTNFHFCKSRLQCNVIMMFIASFNNIVTISEQHPTHMRTHTHAAKANQLYITCRYKKGTQNLCSMANLSYNHIMQSRRTLRRCTQASRKLMYMYDADVRTRVRVYLCDRTGLCTCSRSRWAFVL